MQKELVIVAHNIRSAYNVGAIFRTADGMGARKVYLTGYSPRPFLPKDVLIRRDQRMIAKTALGAEKSLAWEKVIQVGKVLEKLKKSSFELVALEQYPQSQNYSQFRPRFPLALIVGNEPKGISQRMLKNCDQIIEIPMHGTKNSLNVAVALGVAGYAIMNDRKQ